MNEKPFYQTTVFKVSLLGVLFQGGYFLYSFFTDGLKFAAFRFAEDVLLFFIGLAAWQFFFSQFILPVRNNEDRKKIYDRVRAGADSPALFIEGGKIIEKVGESKRQEAGVIWLDSASGAVLKTLTNFTRTVGPGVVFTDKGESIAGTVDLRIQTRSAGPKEGENPFCREAEDDDEIQKRRLEVSALTRDGIEIVPQITISFKIDAAPASGKEPGSRFGYDKDAVYKAVSRMGINPDATSRSEQHNVAWHQLPIYLAVDLWREYLSKFTLEELFQATQDVPPIVDDGQSDEIPASPAESEGAAQGREFGVRGVLFDWYKSLTNALKKRNDDCDERLSPPLQDEERTVSAKYAFSRTHENTQKVTALQAIHCMIMQRLTKPYYDLADVYGQLTGEKRRSREYVFLTEERGIRILDMRVSNLMFDEEIERQLLEKWTTTWFLNAEEERKHIEGEQRICKLRGREKALLDYAKAVSEELLRSNPANSREVLKSLLCGTRKELIRNNHLLRKSDTEVEELTDLIQWIDKGNGHG